MVTNTEISQEALTSLFSIIIARANDNAWNVFFLSHSNKYQIVFEDYGYVSFCAWSSTNILHILISNLLHWMSGVHSLKNLGFSKSVSATVASCLPKDAKFGNHVGCLYANDQFRSDYAKSFSFISLSWFQWKVESREKPIWNAEIRLGNKSQVIKRS